MYIENIGFYISKYRICESVMKMSHLPDLLTNTHIEEHQYKLQAFQTDSTRSIYFQQKLIGYIGGVDHFCATRIVLLNNLHKIC